MTTDTVVTPEDEVRACNLLERWGLAAYNTYLLRSQAERSRAEDRVCVLAKEFAAVRQEQRARDAAIEAALREILEQYCYKTEDIVASYAAMAKHMSNLQITCQKAGISVGLDGTALRAERMALRARVEQLKAGPVPPTIATDDGFRDVYGQGYRHGLGDVLALLD